MPEFKDLEIVKLKIDIGKIKSGTIGTIVAVCQDNKSIIGYVVEISDENGRAIELLDVTPDQIQKV